MPNLNFMCAIKKNEIQLMKFVFKIWVLFSWCKKLVLFKLLNPSKTKTMWKLMPNTNFMCVIKKIKYSSWNQYLKYEYNFMLKFWCKNKICAIQNFKSFKEQNCVKTYAISEFNMCLKKKSNWVHEIII